MSNKVSTTPTPAPNSSVGAATAATVAVTSYYTDKVAELDGQFNTKIASLSAAYVNTKLFPDNTEYQNVYTRNLSAINTIKSNMFELQNEVEGSVENYRDKNNILSVKIKKERTRENGIVHDFEQAEDSGAAGARKVLTDMYKLQYASNFFMVLGIVVALIIMFKMFAGGKKDAMTATDYGSSDSSFSDYTDSSSSSSSTNE